MLSVAASSAQASVLSSYLSFDGPTHHTDPVSPGGGEDFLQDDSVSAWSDRNDDGLLNEGDVVWGVLTLSEISASGDAFSQQVESPNQIAVVFSVELGPETAPGSGIFTNNPIGDSGDPLDLRNLLAGSGASGLNDNSIATILSSDEANLASENPTNFTTANFTANFASGIWDWELTADLIPDTDDFFHFQGDETGGTDAAALTITSQNADLPGWLLVDVVDFEGNIHYGDITLDRGEVDPATASQSARGWFFRDTSDLFVNPVPEPGSMAVFGLLGAAAFARARRRNKK
jgi:hypothetical protein